MGNKMTKEFIKAAEKHMNALHNLCVEYDIEYLNCTVGKKYSTDFHSFEGHVRTFEGEIFYNPDDTYSTRLLESTIISTDKL